MLIYFVDMSLKILSCSISFTSRFLSAPGYESHGSSWFESESLQHSESFENSDESSSIIIGSSLWSSIPSINMATSKDDLIRLLRSLDFKNKIVRITIGNKLSLNNKMNNNILSSILHSSKHLWIFNSNSSTWDFRVFMIIFHIPSMNRIDTIRCNWSNKHCFSSIFSCDWWTINSVLNWMRIVNPFIIKKNYFTRNIILSLLELIKSINNNNWTLNITNIKKKSTLILSLPKQSMTT